MNVRADFTEAQPVIDLRAEQRRVLLDELASARHRLADAIARRLPMSEAWARVDIANLEERIA